MIYNSTYNDIEKEIETNNLVGKKFNLIKSIRLSGIGSKRLIVEDLSVNFKKMIQQKNDLIYSNIELRNKGIIVYIVEGQKRFTWVIVVKHGGLLFHIWGYSIQFWESF